MKKVVIVGGGFAGWYTAAFLSHKFKQFDITVIDSDKHSRLGVGETFGWSAPYDQKRLLGLSDDRMLMWETGAIYKYGIQPINFYKDNTLYAYGKFYNLKIKALTRFFGTFEYPEYAENWNKSDDVGLLEAWLSINKHTNKTFEDFALELNDSTIFAQYPYAPYLNDNYVLRPQEGWSYHMDVEKTVEFFKSISKYKHLNYEVVDITYNDSGIKSLCLESGETVTADLFIDCSGFKRVLVKNNPNFEWISVDDRFNNSACVVQTRYTDPQKQMIGSTKFYGEDWGWRFWIPLYHRQGNGYVFNDRIIETDQVYDYMNKITAGTNITSPKVIKWQPGYYKRSFIGNTLALGVSSHFVDPFDGPSYDLHSRNLEDFLNYHNDHDSYNNAHAIVSEERLTRLLVTFGLNKKQGDYWDSRRELFTDYGYDKKFNDIMNGNELLGDRYKHFWQQMYYRLCVISDFDRTTIDTKKLTDADKHMAQSFFDYLKVRNQYIKQLKWPNYYEWLREHRFNGQSHDKVLERIG